MPMIAAAIIVAVAVVVSSAVVATGMSEQAKATKYGFDQQRIMNIRVAEIQANAQIKEAQINQEIASADRQYSREWDRRADAQADKFFNEIDRLTEDSVDDIRVERRQEYSMPQPSGHTGHA